MDPNTPFLEVLAHSAASGKLLWFMTEKRIRAIPPNRSRMYDNSMCPLTAMHWLTRPGKHLRPHEWGQAAFGLGCDLNWAEQVVAAADATPGYNPILRSYLRKAVGLTYVWPEDRGYLERDFQP